MNGQATQSRTPRRWLAGFLSGLMLVSLVGCSDAPSAQETQIADFGTFGSDLALELASEFPNRSPGSDQEAAARAFLQEAFKDLGYKVTVQDFTFTNADGEAIPSANLIIRIAGDGVQVIDSQGETSTERRQVIIGAHYDVRITAEQAEQAEQAARAEAAAVAEAIAAEQAAQTEAGAETSESAAMDQISDPSGPSGTADQMPTPTLADFDGIHANASGIGALLTVAAQLKRVDLDYDVLLVAFGAGTADQAGAKAFVKGAMSDDDLTRTDAMYNIDGIYAGDDMYAHAGQNSVLPGNQKIYEKRRKLYEATDVFFENELYSRNGYNLNTNQASINILWNDSGETAIYREWTVHRSDHTPFDEAGIPIVFFESFDYDYKTVDDMKESKNPALSSTQGTIRDTAFDSTAFLQYLFTNDLPQAIDSEDTDVVPIDRLEQRINNTAFIIVEAVKRRPADPTATTKE